MRNCLVIILTIILAGGRALIVAGIASYVLVQAVVHSVGPIFWEGGEIFLPLIATVVGGIIGLMSIAVCALANLAGPAIPLRWVGLSLGVSLSFAYSLVLISSGSFTSPHAPTGMSFWTVVILLTSGGLAGMIGGRTIDVEKEQFNSHNPWVMAAIVTAVVAALVGLVVTQL